VSLYRSRKARIGSGQLGSCCWVEARAGGVTVAILGRSLYRSLGLVGLRLSTHDGGTRREHKPRKGRRRVSFGSSAPGRDQGQADAGGRAGGRRGCEVWGAGRQAFGNLLVHVTSGGRQTPTAPPYPPLGPSELLPPLPPSTSFPSAFHTRLATPLTLSISLLLCLLGPAQQSRPRRRLLPSTSPRRLRREPKPRLPLVISLRCQLRPSRPRLTPARAPSALPVPARPSSASRPARPTFSPTSSPVRPLFRPASLVGSKPAPG